MTTARTMPPKPSRGFTLLELMISVALILVLLLGINEVFRLTSETINVSQALSTGLRDQRAAKTTFSDDFTNAAPDGPAFIITNQAVAAFRNKADEASAADRFDPTWIEDLNKDTIKTNDETASPARPGNRIYRIDTVTFFTRKDAAQRGKNIGSTLTLPDSLAQSRSGESLVSYGHVRLPDDSLAEWFDPGQPDDSVSNKKNNNNRYASQWMLGRRQMILTPFVGSGQTPQPTAWYPFSNNPASNGLNLSPLAMATGNTTSGGSSVASPTGTLASGGLLANRAGPAGVPVETVFNTTAADRPRPWTSEVDLAVTSIASFTNILANYQRDISSLGIGNSPYNSSSNSGLWYIPANPIPTGTGSDYSKTLSKATQTLVFRPEVNPFGPRYDVANPTDPVKNSQALSKLLAQTAPIFLPRCSQFIVEYAGDFTTQVNDITQDAFGLAISDQPDGQIDYIVDPNTGAKRIRWYGLPRYTNSGDVSTSGTYVGPRVMGWNNGTTISYPSIPPMKTYRDNRYFPDVVPLSDILMSIPDSTNTLKAQGANRNAAPFERVIMTTRTQGQADPNDTSGTQVYFALNNNPLNNLSLNPTLRANGFEAQPSNNYADPSNGFNIQNANYVCAWSGGGPKLIRITITLEDPNAKPSVAPQTYEYVFTLPY